MFTVQSIWLTDCLQQLRKPQCLDVRTKSDHNHVCDVSLVGLTCKLGSSRTVIAHTLRLFKLSRPKRQRISTNFPLRAKVQGSVAGRRFNLSKTSGGSENKTLQTRKDHVDVCYVGDGNWLVHNFEPNTDCGFFELPNSTLSEREANEHDSDLSDFHDSVVSGFMSFITAATVVLPGHQMAKRTVLSLTKPRNAEVRRQSQSL